MPKAVTLLLRPAHGQQPHPRLSNTQLRMRQYVSLVQLSCCTDTLESRCTVVQCHAPDARGAVLQPGQRGGQLVVAQQQLRVRPCRAGTPQELRPPPRDQGQDGPPVRMPKLASFRRNRDLFQKKSQQCCCGAPGKGWDTAEYLGKDVVRDADGARLAVRPAGHGAQRLTAAGGALADGCRPAHGLGGVLSAAKCFAKG